MAETELSCPACGTVRLAMRPKLAHPSQVKSTVLFVVRCLHCEDDVRETNSLVKAYKWLTLSPAMVVRDA